MTSTDPAAAPARPDRRAGKTPAELWADGIAHFEAFIAEHGHARVPGTFVCEDGMRLGLWVMRCRKDRRLGAERLTDERIAQLDDLGFDWTPPRGRTIDDFAEQWANGIDHLARYRDAHGHLDVPPRWVCEDGFRLGEWASRRRAERRRESPTLTPERIRQLDALGFGWGPRTTRSTFEQQRWANAVAHLTDYVAEHGHARVPHRFTCPDGFRLGIWVFTRRADRRHALASLTPERITELDNLGFDWGTTRAKR